MDALEADTEPDGGFEIEGVLPGRYRLRMDCVSGYNSAIPHGGNRFAGKRRTSDRTGGRRRFKRSWVRMAERWM